MCIVHTARGLAKDGHPVRIAAKLRNIVPNPFQRETLIFQAGILGAFFSKGIRPCESKDCR